MSDDATDAVKDRFAQRFDSVTDESEENDEIEKGAKNDTQSNGEQSSENSKNNKAVNVKSEWTNHSVYLADELASELSRSYKRLDLDLDEEYDLSIKKTRHYYPLIVKLGLERLEELESKEIKEELERIES